MWFSKEKTLGFYKHYLVKALFSEVKRTQKDHKSDLNDWITNQYETDEKVFCWQKNVFLLANSQFTMICIVEAIDMLFNALESLRWLSPITKLIE